MERNLPLARFPILNTNSIEQAEFEIAQTLSQIEILKIQDSKRFRVEMNNVNFEYTSLVVNKFHSSTSTNAGSLGDSFFFIYSDHAPIGFDYPKKKIVITSDKAIALMPGNLKHIDRHGGSEAIAVRTTMADIAHHLELLTSKHHKEPLVFKDTICLKSGPGATLKRMINYLFQELSDSDQLLTNPAFKRSIDHTLLSALLSLPHNLSRKLNDERNHVAPACVRKAEEYMREYFMEPITIIDLLRVADCSRSVLFSAFRNARGYSPMEFLTEQRLQIVHEKLIKPDKNSSVSTLAMSCGFTSLGRFAQIYRKRFGESPSDTLRGKN
jgi:AraC-like DNA-binding protein